MTARASHGAVSVLSPIDRSLASRPCHAIRRQALAADSSGGQEALGCPYAQRVPARERRCCDAGAVGSDHVGVGVLVDAVLHAPGPPGRWWSARTAHQRPASAQRGSQRVVRCAIRRRAPPPTTLRRTIVRRSVPLGSPGFGPSRRRPSVRPGTSYSSGVFTSRARGVVVKVAVRCELGGGALREIGMPLGVERADRVVPAPPLVVRPDRRSLSRSTKPTPGPASLWNGSALRAAGWGRVGASFFAVGTLPARFTGSSGGSTGAAGGTVRSPRRSRGRRASSRAW
jgi:hypothetical protein